MFHEFTAKSRTQNESNVFNGIMIFCWFIAATNRRFRG